MASNGVTRNHHNLRRNLNLNDKYISNDGGDEGIQITDTGIVTVSSALSIKESASPVNHLDTYGRLWVVTSPEATRRARYTLSRTPLIKTAYRWCPTAPS